MGFQWESVNKNTDISQKWTYSLEKKKCHFNSVIIEIYDEKSSYAL